MVRLLDRILLEQREKAAVRPSNPNVRFLDSTVRGPRSFEYTVDLVKDTEPDPFFTNLPKSIQRSMVNLWQREGEPEAMRFHVERWLERPDSHPRLSRYRTTIEVLRRKTPRSYHQFRKDFLAIAGISK